MSEYQKMHEALHKAMEFWKESIGTDTTGVTLNIQAVTAHALVDIAESLNGICNNEQLPYILAKMADSLIRLSQAVDDVYDVGTVLRTRDR